MDTASIMDAAVTFLTGAFPYSAEFQNVGMAVEGAMKVRKGPNKNGTLHWFHAFMVSIVGAFGGGIMNFIWLGKPSGFLANDLAMGSCILAFVLVNYIPFRAGFYICDFLPVSMIITSGAFLFRSLGLVKFCNAAFQTFKDNPSPYYPIPVFGPILYATLLANMGAFVLKGFENHVGNGVPWPVQNGIFCASFYLFYAKDTEGPIGTYLRAAVPLAEMLGLDNETFACCFVSLFMQIMGILQMPEFLGPTFTPFGPALLSPFLDSSTWNVGNQQTAYAAQKQAEAAKPPAKKPAEPVQQRAVSESKGESAGAEEATKRKKKKNKKKGGDTKEKVHTD